MPIITSIWGLGLLKLNSLDNRVHQKVWRGIGYVLGTKPPLRAYQDNSPGEEEEGADAIMVNVRLQSLHAARQGLG